MLADQSGPYADSSGPGSVLAARLAAADAGDTVLGKPVEVLAGDSLNKPDVASVVARQWFDEGVDAAVGLPVTPVAAAVQQIAKEKGRTVMITGAAVTDFTNRLCSPLSTHWADDTHALTTGVARNMVANGGRTWFFITVDFTFGRAIEAEASAIVRAGGGEVLGSAYFPIASTDFSAQLTQARACGAEVIGIAAVGNDQVNLIKQASEFGVGGRSKQRLATFLVYITDIHALGLAATQDLMLASGFYWDQSETSRAFAQRFYAAR
ncbi:MAG TPA: ABC transporter substrate-binding protein, partial [Acetobacteraceae bacterium]|nr:ABC transporter substrate-binding protein [Acetobacteraceae bacterium]